MITIGIDIDDTISKTNEKIFEYARDFNLKKFNSKHEDINTTNLLKRFNWLDITLQEFFSNYLKEILLNVEKIEYSLEIINKLYEEGNKIIFISSRNYDYKDPYEVTDFWLSQNGYKYDKLFCDVVDKENVCFDEEIDLFIDDNFRNIERVNESGIKTIWFTNESKQVHYKKIYDWRKIYDYIKNEFE